MGALPANSHSPGMFVPPMPPCPEVSMEVSGNPKKLPENAYRRLNEGENYVPVIPAEKIVPELT